MISNLIIITINYFLFLKIDFYFVIFFVMSGMKYIKNNVICADDRSGHARDDATVG